MRQIAQPIWNQIAQNRQPQTETYQKLFLLNESQIEPALEELEQELESEGIQDNSVILAFQTVAPLLMERATIQSYLNKQPQFQEAFPEVLTVDESVLLIQKEYWLSEKQSSQLKELLQAKVKAWMKN